MVPKAGLMSNPRLVLLERQSLRRFRRTPRHMVVSGLWPRRLVNQRFGRIVAPTAEWCPLILGISGPENALIGIRQFSLRPGAPMATVSDRRQAPPGQLTPLRALHGLRDPH